jgi:hypothetical protein
VYVWGFPIREIYACRRINNRDIRVFVSVLNHTRQRITIFKVYTLIQLSSKDFKLNPASVSIYLNFLKGEIHETRLSKLLDM